MQAFAMARSLTLGEVLNHVGMVDELSGSAKDSLSNFWNHILKWKALAKEKSVSDLIKIIMSDIDYKTYLMDGSEEGEMRYENAQELVSVASKYDGLDPDLSLLSFLEEVALVADTDALKDDDSALTLMTLHSAKGLEYPYVFILGCEENIFPHSRSLYDPDEMEEERRLMYVGVTRAMKKLYLLAAKQRIVFGDHQANPLSRFIDDIPEHLISTNSKLEARNSMPETPSFNSFNQEIAYTERPKIAEEKFKDGDKVIHASFGEGIVVERRGDLVTVSFKDKIFGIKKFAANIAPLEKI
jgi:DNA helicase-2/ATP-dependent DNA helicase PcrA